MADHRVVQPVKVGEGRKLRDLPHRVTRPSLAVTVSWFIAAVLALVLIEFFFMTPGWHWDIVAQYLFSQRVLAGLWATIYLTVCITVLGLALGLVVAYCRLSSNPVLRLFAALYIWVIRAMPPLVMLLLIFFFAALSPTIGIGIPFGPTLWETDTNDVITRFSAAVIGLGLYLGGYSGEIYRGGIMSVPQGQYEASKALGLTPFQTTVQVVAPQAVRVIIPPMSNEVITIFKSTSLVVVIGYMELLTTVQQIYARNFQTIPLLMVAVIWYLVLTSLAMVGQAQLEKRFGRGFSRRNGNAAQAKHVLTNAQEEPLVDAEQVDIEQADTRALAAQHRKKGWRRG